MKSCKKSKKSIFLALAFAALIAMSLSACGGGASPATQAPAAPTTAPAAKTDAPAPDSAPEANAPAELPPMTLEVYSQPANFQGEQSGWTAKILKDKFNITLSIIAPQAAGGDIFAARSASGFLGDIVVLDNADIQSCIKSGLITDFTAEMQTLQSFNEYKPQLDYYNSSLEGAGPGKYFAWPTELTNTSPVSFSPTIPGVAPTVPWDYYREIGAPEVKNLTDLVSALKAMQDKYPTNSAGDPSYGITLWPDWDGTSIENVNQLTKWYGQEVNGSILIDTKGNMAELVDDAGAYKRILQFYFDANQAGVVDPDSGTQNWDSVNSKFTSKRAFLIWNDWQQGFWNTSTRGEAGENYMMLPIGDMLIYQPSDSYYGSGRAFAVGTSDPEKKERVRLLFDWMSSPEGLDAMHGGIYGFIFEDDPNGKGYVLTDIGEYALMDNSPVPDEFGGGLYADGMMQINQWMLAGAAINPKTKAPFAEEYWPTTLEKRQTLTTKEWSERFGAEDPMAYLEKNNQVGVVPFVNVSLNPDPSDISVIRTSCGPLVCDASWKMIFAKDQAEFDRLWNTLKTDLQGFDWAKLVQFDKDKYKALVDERARALAAN
ncbi:MAG: sugar ABC transporter substrate-binding protein [Clostridiales bacterium]|nr:sugar ABC transporter substrate-binding protein [Clostridiales bacterium]